MSKSSPPATPNYTGAAQQQGTANTQTAVTQSQLNNPNVVGPYGTQTTTYGGSYQPPQLSAAQQSFYNKGIIPGTTPGTVRSTAGGPSISPQEAIGYASNGLSQSDLQNLTDYANSTGDLRAYLTGIVAGNTPGTVKSVYGGPDISPNEALRYNPGVDLSSLTNIATNANPYTPTITQTLSPPQQHILNQQQENQIGLGQLAKQGITSAQGILGQPIDYSGLSAQPANPQQINQDVVNAMMQRPLQDYNINKQNLQSQLVAAGIRPGTQAYDTQMNLLDRQLTDAQTQAELAGVQAGSTMFGEQNTARQQALAEYMNKLNTPLNQITGLMSGSQVSSPFTMPSYAQNSSVQAAPLYNAAQSAAQYNTDVWNAKQAQQGNLQSGLFGLGGAGLMTAGMLL